MHVPGLQVVVPSTPKDAKGLLKTAVRSPDPVMFMEYKRIYTSEGEVPDEEFLIPFGEAEIKREGEDATVIGIGPMVGKSLDAGILLEDDGFDIEVVDPRTLSPLDTDTICDSVRKTGRVVVCEEDSSFAGTGAEIAAMIAEKCFNDLQAPVIRVGMPHVPMPFAPSLADSVVPGVDDIIDAVHRVMA